MRDIPVDKFSNRTIFHFIRSAEGAVMRRHESGTGCGAPDNARRDGAPGGAAPYVIGRARPEAVTLGNQEWPWAHGGLSPSPPKGGLAPPPWRHRKSGLPDLRIKHARSRVNPRSGALHSLIGGRGKRDTGVPGAFKNTGDSACLRGFCLKIESGTNKRAAANSAVVPAKAGTHTPCRVRFTKQ
jgi:hypothetical protein